MKCNLSGAMQRVEIPVGFIEALEILIKRFIIEKTTKKKKNDPR